MDTKLKVSISIINWNGKNVLMDCLSAVRELEYPIYQIILVDNGSTDGSVAAVKESFPEVTLVEKDKNYGVILARNIGLRTALESPMDYVLLLDNDIIANSSTLRHMIDVAENDPTIGLVGAKLYYYDKPDVLFSAGGYINYTQNIHGNRGQNEKDRGQYDRLQEVHSLGFACMLIRRKVLETVGLLDPNYIGYGFGDTDFSMRVRHAGYKIMFCPMAKVWHKHESSSSNRRYTFRKKYLEARNAIRFVTKYGTTKDRAKYAFFVGLGIPYSAVREGLRGNLPGVIGKVCGLLDGLRGRDELALKMFEADSDNIKSVRTGQEHNQI